MAIIVSDSNNASYDGNLATANGFYTGVASNLGTASSSVLSIGTTRYIAFTASAAGNCQGVVLGIYNSSNSTPTTMYGVKVTLQQNTGSWVDVAGATAELTAAQINQEYAAGGNSVMSTFQAFKFGTPAAITNAAATWRFKVERGTTAGSSGDWSLATSDATNPSFVTWIDTTVTAADGDTLIVVDDIDIDKSISLTGIAGTGETTTGIAGWICSGAAFTCYAPAAAYTITLGGVIQLAAWSQFLLGTSAARVSNATELTFVAKTTPDYGTVRPGLMYTIGSSARPRGRCIVKCYGEIPTKAFGTLASDAATGQAHIIMTEDLSATWGVNDYLHIGRQDTKGRGVLTFHQISSFSGADITLSTNLATNTRKATGIVINRDRGYGIQFKGFSNATGKSMALQFGQPAEFIMSGVKFTDTTLNIGYGTTSSQYPALAANRSQYQITDCLFWTDGTATTAFMPAVYIPPEGILIQRTHCIGGNYPSGVVAYYYRTVTGNPHISGYLEMYDNYIQSSYTTSTNATGAANTKIKMERNKWANAGTTSVQVLITGQNSTWIDNDVYGGAATQTIGGSVNIGATTSLRASGNTYDNNAIALGYVGLGTIIDGLMENDEFGQVQANTTDVNFLGANYYDLKIKSPTGTLTYDFTNVTDSVSSSKLVILDQDDVANEDSGIRTTGRWYRTGYGLADTNVWTGTAWGAASAGQFGIKFEPKNPDEAFVYEDNNGSTTIGDCNGLIVTVSARIKINHANYYAGTHTNPTLRVYYDDGASYVDAVATNTTDGQLLQVSFQPTTSSQFIKIQIFGITDATGTEAQFYLGKLVVASPSGVLIDTTGIGSWSNGLPLGTFRTYPAPSSVWNEAVSAFDATGTFGEKVGSKLATKANLAPLM